MADIVRFSFGDSPQMADELLACVLAGDKTATCWAAVHGMLGAAPGKREIVMDSAARDRAVIEWTEITQRRYDEVPFEFAHAEGEGERTLESWRRDHQAYFTREGTFATDMLLNCGRFRLVETIPVGAGQ